MHEQATGSSTPTAHTHLAPPQIGWATINCPFTAEEGVGDAPDSYAVDGKRIR